MRSRHNLIAKVHGQIIQELLGSHFAVGQRLGFAELAGRYRVSRTPGQRSPCHFGEAGLSDTFSSPGLYGTPFLQAGYY